ncbi:transient receptor potential cation channel subfamily A member 1 homolog [Choristoneura fumiferana]|uniref:transient receptor potential cation channel subfamily A member 1 homolog n=1 Tax=Choristoneura fumiferana TaxID=7141 RepID=UPI003D153822
MNSDDEANYIVIECSGDMEMAIRPLEESAANCRSSLPLDLSTPQSGNNQPRASEVMALHRAVELHDVTAIADLMKEGASPAALDSNGLTPLHLCIVKKFIEPFTILLTYEGSANVLDASGLSVLCVAILHIWRDGVSAALAAGAKVTVEELPYVPEPDIIQRYPQAMLSKFGSNFYEDTILHLAAKSGEIEVVDKIAAAIKYTSDTGIDCLNKRGVTPLHTAIESGDLDAVQVLIRRGASVNRVSDQNDTALHIAVHHPHILKYLLDETDVKNCFNDQGSAPIHLAVGINKLQSVRLLLDIKQQHIELSTEVQTKRLLRGPSRGRLPSMDLKSDVSRYPFRQVRTLTQILSLDGNGYTPLHLAAKQRNMSMITMLLRKGAKLSTKGARGRTALEIIAREFYNPSKCFELIFDEFISTKLVVSDTVVKVDYNALTARNGMTQMKVIEELVRCGQRKTLIHPLIESLLYLKWKHLLPLFYAMIGIYTTFLMTFNVFVVHVIHYRDKNKNSYNTSVLSNSEVAWSDLFYGWYWLLITLIYSSIALLLLQELFYMYLRKFRYFLTLESWVKLTCLTLGGIVPIAESLAVQPSWHRHAASTALLLTWLQTMFLVSRFPRWGYYVLIFGKVTVNIFKILLTSICLIIGFSFCFMIEFQWAPPFDDPFAAFVKTVVMMSSEFEYETLFDNEHASDLQDTKTVIRLVFVLFVIFVAIILMNFMIGVAVSDINDLQMAGSIKRLEKQVELLSSLEILVNNPLFANLYTKRFSNKKYHKNISNYVGFQSKWRAALCGEYVYHLDLPSALHAAIIDIAWKKEQRNEKNNIVITNTYKLNALYDAVVDRPVVTDEISNEEKANKENKKPREEKSRLNIQIKLLNDGLAVVNNDVKNAMIKVKQISSDITTLKVMLASHAFDKSSENQSKSQCYKSGLRKNSF